MFIAFHYMFRATMRPSSGEDTVPMRHWYLSLYKRQSSIQSDKHQVSHRYSIFYWWWAHSYPKHVEKRNKHIKKICAPSCFYLQKIIMMCLNLNWISEGKSKIVSGLILKAYLGIELFLHSLLISPLAWDESRVFLSAFCSPRKRTFVTNSIGGRVGPIYFGKGKGKGHPCTGTAALYRPYDP